VDPRFLSLFSIFNIAFPKEASLVKIYSSIMRGHLTSFKGEVQAMTDNLVQATLKLYNSVLSSLPPTPSKFHYIFNLRDISRVFEGLCLATPDHFDSNPQRLVRLWRNESLRVFHDRLINDEDKSYVQGLVSKVILEYFEPHHTFAMKDPILFGDFRYAAAGGESEGQAARLYEDLLDFTAVRFIVQEILEEYNIKYKPMNLVLFEDALDHLTRIHRIIRMSRGHALLVGVAGSGKQSLTKLAAFTAGFSYTYEITLSRGYGENEFLENLKELYRSVGLENKKVVFLLTDAHIIIEGFLEAINNILTSGIVPALFADDEKDAIINGIRDEATKAGVNPVKESIWSYFCSKAAENLHIVLCMSPTGDKLRTRCRNFPGLVNNTVIDWFPPWPENALNSVADAYLSTTMSDDSTISKENREAIVKHMVNVHLSVGQASTEFLQKYRRMCFMTPKNYLDYISTYFKLLKEKREQNAQLYSRLESGMGKLEEASRQLDDLNAKLAEQNIAVKNKTEACNRLLEVIATNTTAAEEKKEMASKKESELTVQNLQIVKDKEEAEAALVR
jgi:dynein heavy chain